MDGGHKVAGLKPEETSSYTENEILFRCKQESQRRVSNTRKESKEPHMMLQISMCNISWLNIHSWRQIQGLGWSVHRQEGMSSTRWALHSSTNRTSHMALTPSKDSFQVKWVKLFHTPCKKHPSKVLQQKPLHFWNLMNTFQHFTHVTHLLILSFTVFFHLFYLLALSQSFNLFCRLGTEFFVQLFHYHTNLSHYSTLNHFPHL